MSNLIITLAIYLNPGTCDLAATDYKCLNECIADGYMYGYCKRICSY